MVVALDLLDETLRINIGLTQLENSTVRKMLSLLDEADGDLVRQIEKALDRAASEDAVRRLKVIRGELATVNREAYGAVGKALSSDLQEISERTSLRYEQMLETVTAPLQASWSRPSRQVLQSIVTSKPFQGALLKDHVDKLAGNRLAALTRGLEVGLVQGESLSQMLQRIRGTRRGKFQDGILQLVGRRQLEPMVRTAMQHVTEEARETLYRESADLITGRMWVSTLDHRTCKLCQLRDGLVWRYDEEAGVYVADGHDVEWGPGPGRLHWQCRCTAIPILGNVAELQNAGVDLERLTRGQRAAFQNPVPAKVSYGPWLRKQPREIQLAALGSRRRVEALASGKSLEEVWAQKFVPKIVPPAPIDEVLPEGILDGPTIRQRLESTIGQVLEEQASLADQMRVLEDQFYELKVLPQTAATIEKMNKVVKRFRAKEAEVLGLAKPISDQLASLLAQGKKPVKFAVRYSTPGTKKSKSAIVEPALSFLSRVWGRKPIAEVVTVESTPGNRAYYLPSRRVVRLTRHSNSGTVVHELMHAFEHYDKALYTRAVAFRDARTAGEPLEHMGPLYEADEFTRPDDFVRRYMGKVYNGEATEIVSMGVEWLMQDPASLILRDPGYFDFIVELISGQ